MVIRPILRAEAPPKRRGVSGRDKHVFMSFLSARVGENEKTDVGSLSEGATMRVLVIAPFDSSGHGGLERYVQDLKSVESAPPHVEFKVADIAPDPWHRRVERWLPLMTRPKLRWIARRLAENAGAKELDRLTDGYDAVHFVGTGWDLLGFPLSKAAKAKQIPITCWPAVHPKSWGDAPLDIDLYQRMDAVFVQSDYEADHLAERGVARSKLVRCGCAAPTNLTGDGERFRLSNGLGDTPIVLFIGRKDRGKGYHALREAVGQIHEQGKPIKLVSIGRDCEPPYPGLPDSVDVDLGVADEQTKHNALAACDVFALPSEAESFGIVYVEAWSYGMPVVGGTAPASRELIQRHSGGLLSDGSAADIAVQLSRLIDNPAERRAFGESGRAAVLSDYSLEQVMATHHAVWNRLIHEAG